MQTPDKPLQRLLNEGSLDGAGTRCDGCRAAEWVLYSAPHTLSAFRVWAGLPSLQSSYR